MSKPVHEGHPCRRLILSTAILTIVVLGAAAVIARSDKPLACTCTHKSSALEWISAPAVANQIVNDWKRWNDNVGCTVGSVEIAKFSATWVVTRGIFIDFAFIVIYAFGLAWLVRQSGAAIRIDRRWPTVAAPLSRFMLLAGLLDVIENVGILLELYARWFGLAPIVAFVAVTKWVFVSIGVLFVLLSIAYCLLIHAHRRRHGIDERTERRLLLEFNRV